MQRISFVIIVHIIAYLSCFYEAIGKHQVREQLVMEVGMHLLGRLFSLEKSRLK